MAFTKRLSVSLLALWAVALPVSAQQEAPEVDRTRELEELILRLNDRIDKLEKRLDAYESSDAAPPAPAPVEIRRRVEKLEQSVEEFGSRAPPPDGSSETVRWFSDDLNLRAFWNDGLSFETIDESFSMKVGGRIHIDTAFINESSGLERNIGQNIEDNSEFRRARLVVSGTTPDAFEFKAEYDFAGGDADLKDVYVGHTNVPIVGGIRIGHFREPFGLEELTSSNDTTFLERSLAETFTQSRNVGVMLHNRVLDGRMTWAAGIFRASDDFGRGETGRAFNGTARLTGLPWYEDDGRKLLHLGVSFTHKNFADDTLRYSERPESHLTATFLDTGDFPADYADVVYAEAAWVHNAFSLQSEFVQSFVKSRPMSDPRFWAAYVQASYFLTGEHRPYKKSKGAFTKLRPKRNFDRDGGWGAWELAARYSYLDLSDGEIDGGKLRDFTLGLNWYLNPNFRIIWNYGYADAADRGSANIFQWRFSFVF